MLFSSRRKLTLTGRDEALFYFSVGVFFLVSLLITINAGFIYKAIGKYLHLLFIIPICIFLHHTGVKLFYLWNGIVIGSIMSAGVAIYDVQILNLSRAQGITNSIIFGNMSLLMGAMSIAGFGWFKQRAVWQVMLPVIALICGISTSVLSVARGGWIAVPFIVLILFWHMKSYFSLKQ